MGPQTLAAGRTHIVGLLIPERALAQPDTLAGVLWSHGVRADPIDPNRMSGLPCIRDTRVTVSAVLGQLAAGRSFEEVLADYPYLERPDILAALEFAAAAVQERELPLARPA